MEQYKLIGMRRFALTSWTGDVDFQSAPVRPFDAVKLLNLQYFTVSTNNVTMELNIISHPSWNIGYSVNTNNQPMRYFYQTYLDPRIDQNIYVENLNPIINCDAENQLNKISYEVTINGTRGDDDITPTNPVYIELAFFKIQ